MNKTENTDFSAFVGVRGLSVQFSEKKCRYSLQLCVRILCLCCASVLCVGFVRWRWNVC